MLRSERVEQFENKIPLLTLKRARISIKIVFTSGIPYLPLSFRLFPFVLRARLFSKAINVLLLFQLSIITKGSIETLNPTKQHLTEIGF